MLGRSVGVRREGELEGCAVGQVGVGYQPAFVGFDDRTADRKSHAHATGFCSEEGFEHVSRIVGGESDAAVRYPNVHLVRLLAARSDRQFARAIRERMHCFNAIHDQIDS